MNKLVKKRIWLVIALLILMPKDAFANWVSDYEGTLGDQAIGLAIVQNKAPNGRAYTQHQILSAHYFYTKNLVDIPLELKRRNGRDLIFEEYDNNHNLVATFDLTFATKDPQNHYEDNSKELGEEVLIGKRTDLSGSEVSVYLLLRRGGHIDDDGARCGLSIEEYQKTEARIQRFYLAATTNDTETLKKEFNYKLPSQKSSRDQISKSVPHDLWCNYQGIMLGNGVVWFDLKGNPITR